jgi:hypothetical protein
MVVTALIFLLEAAGTAAYFIACERRLPNQDSRFLGPVLSSRNLEPSRSSLCLSLSLKGFPGYNKGLTTTCTTDSD